MVSAGVGLGVRGRGTYISCPDSRQSPGLQRQVGESVKGTLTVYLGLGDLGYDVPEGLVLGRVPVHLAAAGQQRDGTGQGRCVAGSASTGGGSTKSPRGKGSRMKTV